MKKIFTIILFFTFFSSITLAQYTKLYDFDSINGSQPWSGSLIFDGTFFYGMTIRGGTTNNGVIFKIKPDGTGYSKLFDFDSISGKNPHGALTSDGTTLYGMTSLGGLYGSGTLFKINPNGTGYAILHNFGNADDGGNPMGTLIYDGTFLYGMTQAGGVNTYGTIFKIMTDGTGYSKLYDFDEISGNSPFGSLLLDGIYLYGMTYYGGSGLGSCPGGCGVLFKIKTDGTSYSMLLDFGAATDNNNPCESLIFDGTFLYGTTSNTSTDFEGAIFKIRPDGTQYEELCQMNYIYGTYPVGSLITDGRFLYGTAYWGGLSGGLGTIFEINKDGSGAKKMIDFAGLTNGSHPAGSLISDGIFLYGMTSEGGTNDKGVIFKNCIARYTTFYDSTQNTFNLNVDSTITALAIGYHWDFGDGLSSTIATPTHTYSYDSVYNVCMKMYFASGDSCTYCNLLGKDSIGGIIRNGFTINVINTNSLTNVYQNFFDENNITIFPNPSSGIFQTICANCSVLSLQVYNLLGECILQQIGTQQIDMSNQSNGVYLLNIKTDRGMFSEKLIINK